MSPASARGGRETGLVVGSVCTGYGGLDLGLLAALGGGRLAWVADPDPAAATVLATRFPGVPNLGDITAVDWTAVEPVDVLSAGFPCQDISYAGRGAGITEGTRSGLWFSVLHAVRRLRPPLVVVENVAALRSKRGGLGIVLGTLAGLGYDASWRSVRASDIGAAHRRERIFLLAYPAGTRFLPAPSTPGLDGAGAGTAYPAGPGLARPLPAGPSGQPPDRVQPARDRDPAAAAHAPDHRRARRPATGAAAGPTPPGQPARRGDRLPSGSHAAGPGALDRGWDGRDAAGGAGVGGAASAHPGGGQPQRRGGPDALAGPPAAAPDTGDQRQRDGDAAGDRSPAPTHPTRQRRGQGQPEPAHFRRTARPDRDGDPTTSDAAGGREPQQPDRGHDVPVRAWAGAGHRDQPGDPPDRTRPTRAGRTGSGELAPANAHDLSADAGSVLGIEWGEYAAAIRRWEALLDRPAPHPTEPGRAGQPRLAPAFVEWLMGLPDGWVTGTGLSRAAALRTLGNGVVPAQAAAAVTQLLCDLLLDANAGTRVSAVAA
jgi:DNA (cytosine-5)-methyltransferase 1